MYPVSSAFLNAVKANTRKYYWTGRITTTAGTVYNFDQEDMVKGSGYITSQCCGSTEIELGTVYAAEMGISLFSEINRYTLEDAIVELFYHLQIAGGSYETIPMGIYEVSEANRKAKCLEIKAYDYMVRFEKTFSALESIGNAYDFMVLCSTACDVTLAQDRATIEAMPNGSENLSILPEGWTAETLMQPHDSIPYNPDIANVFYRAGYIETWGQGIQKICDECTALGAELPRYEILGTGIRVYFPALKSALIDQSNTPKGHSAKNDGTLDDTMAYKIIEVIRSKPDITLDQLSTETGIARRTLVRYMSALKEAGRIERVGGKRYGHWEIRDDMK